SGNSADEGGGMDNGGSSNPTVTDCTFSGNSATNGGGMFNGLSSPTVTNCTFSGNNAVSFSGGGMHSQNDSSATITNCTFSGNSAPVGGGMYSSNVPSLTVANCILWGNQPDQIFDNGVGLTVIFSDVQGGFVGTGNIDIDPLFVDADGVDDIVGTDDDDLRLLAVSPALDAGTNTPPGGLPATDLDGNPRVLDGNFDGIVVVDMGAYELNPDTSPVVLNVTQGTLFDSLAAAIGDAVDGDELLASVGAFLAEPNIDLLGKSLTVRSSGAIDQAAGGLYVLADNSSLSTATGQDITLGGELRVRTGESADVVANQLIAGVTSELVARTNAGLFISTTGGTTIDGDATLLAGATMGFAGDVAIGGSMTAISNATASVTGSLSSTGTVSLLNGVTLLSGPLSSSGVMQMSAVTVLAEGFSNLPGGAVVVSGDIFSDITNDSQLTCIGDTLVVGDYTNNDTTIVQIGTLTIIGTLINDGTIIGDVVGGLAPGGGTQPGDGLDISGNFVAGAGSSLLMPDTVWSFGLSGNYDLAIDDNTRYHMAEAELHLAGVAQTLEIMSEDIGATSDGLDPTQPGHYPIGTLRIGPGTTVNMVDDHDNDGLGQIAPEAIYVETLVVDAGAVLNTNGTQVYYVSLTLDGTVDDPANLAQIVSTPPCPWDCATPADGQVSVVDFLALLAQWGQVGASCDFDDSGVSVTDFLALLANWGPCP
ncbi:MAG: right-handed parallel beta-helix repeat-containing protein, partial [Planctomycetota bacterium]